MTAATLDLGDARPIPFPPAGVRRAAQVPDTRAGFWLLMVIGLLVVAAEAIVLIVTVVQDEPLSHGDTTAVAAFVTSILLPVLGIMVVTSGWSQRTAMVTFALEPRRPHVIAAKAMVGLLLTLATIVVALVGAWWRSCSHAALQGRARCGTSGGPGSPPSWSPRRSPCSAASRSPRCCSTPCGHRGLLRLPLGAARPPRARHRADRVVRVARPWIDFQSAQGELYDFPLTGSSGRSCSSPA